MKRSPFSLAACASAAVPGLDPVTVELLPHRLGDQFDSAIVRDTEHRHWVVRAPVTDAAAAALDASRDLLRLLSRRLSVPVPSVKGVIELPQGGRVAVSPLLPGHALNFEALPSGPGLAVALGRALAAVHNLDPLIYEEAGLETYDAETYRARRLSDLDRGAATGRVPTDLLERWEEALENVGLWRFAATPIHGDVVGDHVLAVFEQDDASTGRISGLLGWERAQVADPAEDFAVIASQASSEALDTVLEAYAHARVERPDPQLEVRARLLGELLLVRQLMDALARHEDARADEITDRLHALSERLQAVADTSDDYRGLRVSEPGGSAAATAPIPVRSPRSRAESDSSA